MLACPHTVDFDVLEVAAHEDVALTAVFFGPEVQHKHFVTLEFFTHLVFKVIIYHASHLWENC